MKKINKISYLKNITKILTICLFIIIGLTLFFLSVKIVSFLLQKLVSADSQILKFMCDLIAFIIESIIGLLLNKFTKIPKLIKSCYYSVVKLIYQLLKRVKRSNTKNIFINDFSVNELPFVSQKKIVESIIDENKNFVLVYGGSFSGKTKSMFYMLDDSSERSDLFQLERI